jgi:heme oxygenase
MITLGEEIEKPESYSRLKINLQTFARLHRQQRKLLGKMIFDAIAELYGGGKVRLL